MVGPVMFAASRHVPDPWLRVTLAALAGLTIAYNGANWLKARR